MNIQFGIKILSHDWPVLIPTRIEGSAPFEFSLIDLIVFGFFTRAL